MKKTIRRYVLSVSALIVALSSVTYALDETFYSGNDILFYNSEADCSPQSTSSQITSTAGTKGQISVALANIKQNNQDVPFITRDKPDFVSLNETGRRSVDQLTTAGYDGFRDSSAFKSNAATNQAKSTAILWRKDRWKKVDAGRQIIISEPGPQEWDQGRAITWGVFEDTEGGTTSFISLHHMVNPNKYPLGNAEVRKKRQEIYGSAMDVVIKKVQELSSLGPVIVAGDFNFQISDDNDYGPRKKLASVNMQSTHDSLGRLDGVAVDYIFYTNNLKAEKHSQDPVSAAGNSSDHPYLYATLTADGSGGGSSTISGNNGCVCSATTSTLSLVGNDNTEKAFRFFIGKGYSAQQSAGIVGNMRAESGVLPMRLQNTGAEVETSSKDINLNGLGWGLVQWTPPSKMVNPSRADGRSYEEIDSLAFQLEFLHGQLTGTGVGAAANEKAAGDDLKKQTTIDGSARSFMTKFERPADQSEAAQKHRSQLANEVFGSFNGSAGSGSPTVTGSSSSGCGEGGGDIVSIAQAELAKGVKEDPLGCDAGNPSRSGSCGPEVDKYTDSTLEYWCADFVSWVYKEAGTPFTGGSSGGWRIPAVDSVRAWFQEKATWVDNGPGVKPQPGDVYTMGISHTGIVEKVEGDTIYTISGNTSTDSTGNGNGVGRGEYKIGSSEIEGFGRL